MHLVNGLWVGVPVQIVQVSSKCIISTIAVLVPTNHNHGREWNGNADFEKFTPCQCVWCLVGMFWEGFVSSWYVEWQWAVTSRFLYWYHSSTVARRKSWWHLLGVWSLARTVWLLFGFVFEQCLFENERHYCPDVSAPPRQGVCPTAGVFCFQTTLALLTRTLMSKRLISFLVAVYQVISGWRVFVCVFQRSPRRRVERCPSLLWRKR